MDARGEVRYAGERADVSSGQPISRKTWRSPDLSPCEGSDGASPLATGGGFVFRCSWPTAGGEKEGPWIKPLTASTRSVSSAPLIHRAEPTVPLASIEQDLSCPGRRIANSATRPRWPESESAERAKHEDQLQLSKSSTTDTNRNKYVSSTQMLFVTPKLRTGEQELRELGALENFVDNDRGQRSLLSQWFPARYSLCSHFPSSLLPFPIGSFALESPAIASLARAARVSLQGGLERALPRPAAVFLRGDCSLLAQLVFRLLVGPLLASACIC